MPSPATSAPHSLCRHKMDLTTPHPTRNEMKPVIAKLGQDLEDEVQQDLEEESNRSFLWLEQCNISIWEFRNQNPALMRSLEDELDITKWDRVAEELGLSFQQIERCRTCHRGSFTREVFGIMQECPQYQDLTLKDFLEILLRHKRRDILLMLKKYSRLGREVCAPKTFTLSIQQEREVVVMAANMGRSDGKQSSFMARVLLLHAHDTKEDALKLASTLRNPGTSGRRLNVLLLQQSDNKTVKNSLRVDPWNSIHKWFTMIDAVVPVLSPQFLLQIQNRDLDTGRGWEKRYNRYVYSMILDQYVEYGSKNYSCRAMCPARFQNEVTNNELLRHSGLFKVNWNCSSEEEVEECAQILHDGAKAFRKMKRKWKEELRKITLLNAL
ncbi:hypothetical protein GWK47_054177 [Chionoecetes opilio]|uniref:Death domain-containing protein n=1 Tax=Chionoecetes opilio TaxID=41210 RepID=A0A8J5CP68_CHIOP|nr:hypothetical protein GWK47_054177 [Chionoecetes opilio]